MRTDVASRERVTTPSGLILVELGPDAWLVYFAGPGGELIDAVVHPSMDEAVADLRARRVDRDYILSCRQLAVEIEATHGRAIQ